MYKQTSAIVGSGCHSKHIHILIVSLVFLLIAFPVFSGDGQIDILPGGKAPFVISNPGSYVLTDNVTMISDVHCIDIKTNDVTIDLNGHTLTGTGSGSTCGINGKTYDNVCVFNGKIRNFPSAGINLQDNALVFDILVESNGMGIQINDGAHIRNVISSNNTKYGIYGKNNCLVQNCVSRGNGGTGSTAGIMLEDGCTIKDCVCMNNTCTQNGDYDTYGIYAGSNCTIMNNTCSNNTLDGDSYGEARGIKAMNECVIRNNTCCGNQALKTSGKDAIGIDANYSCVIAGNTCNKNQAKGLARNGCGIVCSAQCLVTDNICYYNANLGTAGVGAGIYVEGANTIVRHNTSSSNSGKGAFNSMGIYIKFIGCRVEDNLCSMHKNGNVNAGIYIEDGSADNVVVRNTTHGNIDMGISMGNAANYCAENMTSETTGIDNTTGVQMGSGDRENVSF